MIFERLLGKTKLVFPEILKSVKSVARLLQSLQGDAADWLQKGCLCLQAARDDAGDIVSGGRALVEAEEAFTSIAEVTALEKLLEVVRDVRAKVDAEKIAGAKLPLSHVEQKESLYAGDAPFLGAGEFVLNKRVRKIAEAFELKKEVEVSGV